MSRSHEGLLHLPPEKIEAIARSLKIVHHETGTLEHWPVNAEQSQMWRDLWLYRQVYVLKVRQIGASTAICLDDVLWVAVNDAAGHRVRCGIVVDTDAKSMERLRVCYDFARQLGIACEPKWGSGTLTFPNGSEIIAITAGGKRAGASMTFHRFHFTELPFWRDPNGSYTSLMQALVLNGRVVIETTMGIDDPTAKDLWIRPNSFFKRFFSYEDHEEYRRPYDPELLDEDTEAFLREEGFTDRESMTDWVWRLRNRCAGDLVRCFREYPQRPEHSWRFAEGRWVLATPRVADPVMDDVCPYTADRVRLNVYRKAAEGSGHYVVGVDTAAGLGQDSSAVVVVDCESAQVMACMKDDRIKIDDLVQVAKYAQELYSRAYRDRQGRWKNEEPPVIIEDNGMGVGTVQSAQANGIRRLVPWKTTKATRYDGLLYAKRFIESGSVWGPEDLAEECDGLLVDDGKFVGPKDLMMAMGFCYTYLASNQSLGRQKDGDQPDNWVDMMQALDRHNRLKKLRGR